MKTVDSEIEIDFPVRVVYNQWTQFEDFPAFMSGVEEVSQLDEKHLHWRVKVGGVEREFDTSITEQVPDQRIEWRTTSGPEHVGVVAFEALEPALTRVHLQLSWSPEGFVESAGAAMKFDDAEVEASLREFQRLLTQNGFATGAWRGTIVGHDVELPGE